MKTWLASIFLVVAACESQPAAPAGDDPADVSAFDDSVTQIRIEIDYERNNEPYTGEVIGFGDPFDLTVANLERIFSGTRTLDVPTTLDAMDEIPVIADEQLSADDLLEIAADHRDLADELDTKTYYVVFVSGNFFADGAAQPGVLGVSLGDTGVIAMFKDVIESTAVPGVPDLERFVEQSALVHELGHAVGLVDSGVPAVATDHHDVAHGAHCTNNRCVMYWLHEGASDMAMFARDVVVSGDTILFDDACLADVDALTGS